MSLKWQAIKQKYSTPEHITLFSNSVRWTTDICNNLDGPQENYSRGKEPISRVYALYDFIYLHFQNDKIIKLENSLVMARLGR